MNSSNAISRGSMQSFNSMDSLNAMQLTILISKFEFYGPFSDVADVDDKAGVLAVLVDEPKGFELVDLYDSENLFLKAKNVLESGVDGLAKVYVAVHYADNLNAEQLVDLKNEILKEFDEPEHVEGFAEL